MNFYTKKVLSIVEQDLSEVPSLEEISSRLGVSRYMLSRQFKSDTGESFSQYVKRRKISEASKEIVSTNRKILDIALDYGYSSQEAFHRTFKELYKETPRSVNFHHSQLFKRNALEVPPAEELGWEIQDYGPVRLNAIGKEFSFNDFEKIAQFWTSFHANNDFKGETFGLSLPSKPDQYEAFYYLVACREENWIENSIMIEIPFKQYAVFTHKGSTDGLMKTFNYIWGRWVFENKNFLVDGMDFELYPENYDPTDTNGYCKIFLPIRNA